MVLPDLITRSEVVAASSEQRAERAERLYT
jgi:hypothetical protein